MVGSGATKGAAIGLRTGVINDQGCSRGRAPHHRAAGGIRRNIGKGLTDAVQLQQGACAQHQAATGWQPVIATRQNDGAARDGHTRQISAGIG